MGKSGYTGLKTLGNISITVGSRTASHPAYINEEEHFDVVLGRSWLEKMGVKWVWFLVVSVNFSPVRAFERSAEIVHILRHGVVKHDSDGTSADSGCRTDPLDQTALTYMDTGESIPCDLVVLKDVDGNVVYITWYPDARAKIGAWEDLDERRGVSGKDGVQVRVLMEISGWNAGTL